ncbi:hypothetical protein Cgig2_010835 [Carnegiea gigantea]|uniref:Protein FAR1-RELATED SEQUENCE n=1 Tax=Carnegiea gigantea TaxID=171969 RepID=A0A9Q1JT07_9CARY|nr:hypothetical protein Cgig2_010835 [Carnegiea gigantea]
MAVLRNEYKNWVGDFYMLYKMNSLEELEDNSDRSESINSFIKGFISSWSSLTDMDVAIKEIELNRIHNNVTEQAFEVLAPFAFKSFKKKLASQCTLIHEKGNEFILRHYKSNGRIRIRIIYRHILRVFILKDCFHIPTSYLPLCWHSNLAKSGGEA